MASTTPRDPKIGLDLALRCGMVRRFSRPDPPTSRNRDVQHPDGLPFFVPPSLKRLLGGAGILTCSPSPTPFGLGLGPTNPEQITFTQETLDLRRMGFSPILSLLVSA